MLDEFVDAFADLMDVVDRGVSSIMKGPHRYPRPKPQGTRQYSYRQQSSTNTTRPRTAQWKWSAPLVGSSTPSISSTRRSKHYLQKHIPFQKKPRVQPPPKLRSSKSLAPTRKVALPPIHKVPERPKAIRSPSSNLLKVPTSPKRIGLLSSDVQIDVSRCDILVVAIADLETCKELFGGWSAQFNLYIISCSAVR